MYAHNFSFTKYKKRTDLSVQTRYLIAYQVLFQRKHGLISELGRKYKTSRQFIYDLGSEFEGLLSPYFSEVVDSGAFDEREACIRAILSLRLEGKCSLESIHSLLTRFEYKHDSVGFISQTLTSIGSKLGDTAPIVQDNVLKMVFVSDEIFAKSSPILVTVEPQSLMILSIELASNRSGESWSSHWANLLEQGYAPTYLVKDEGTGMKAGQAQVLADIPCQSDTFHAVSHRLGLLQVKWEKAAYHSIEEEYKAWDLWDKSQSDTSLNKREIKYLAAKKAANEAIERYDSFRFLYHCLLDCFVLFDASGCLKDTQNRKDDFDTALEYLKAFDCPELQKHLKSIVACKQNLFHFANIAPQILHSLEKTVDKDSLKKLCLAWQCHKNSLKIKHNSTYKKSLLRKEQYLLLEVEKLLAQKYPKIKGNCYSQLDHIVQSSAAVETINAILRPYLANAKNQVSQEFLHLFMFYHNHRRFYQGKRKGKTPSEIFYGKEQELDWIQLILHKIAA